MQASEKTGGRASGDRRQRLGKLSPYADVQIEITLLTFQSVLRSTVISIVALNGADVCLAFYYHDSWLWNLFILMLFISVTRLAIISMFRSRDRTGMTQLQAWQWEAGFGTLTMLHCVATALLTIYAYGDRGVNVQNLMMVGVFALSSGLGSREVTRPWIVLPSGLIMLASLFYCLLIYAKGAGNLAAPAVCLFAYSFISSVLDKFALVVKQLRSKRMLRELAEIDPLTGLANRRQFQNSLEVICRETRDFSILYIDLDGFKLVNDTHGHATGDLLLQQVAVRLRNSIRSGDVLARFGGDEFAILQASLPDEDLPQALAMRINESIATPFSIEGQRIQIAASIGIRTSASTGHVGSHNPGVMLSMADTALYRVKQAGGGSFALAED